MKSFLPGVLIVLLSVSVLDAGEKDGEKKADPKAEKTLQIGDQAPEFAIKDSNGKLIKLADLTKKGPVLVRLTCGCSGCDKELAYFQTLHEAYGCNRRSGEKMGSLYAKSQGVRLGGDQENSESRGVLRKMLCDLNLYMLIIRSSSIL